MLELRGAISAAALDAVVGSDKGASRHQRHCAEITPQDRPGSTTACPIRDTKLREIDDEKRIKIS